MLQVYINLTLNDKEQFVLLTATISNYSLDCPVFIVEMDDCYSLSFESDYEQYELFREFSEHFPGHELIEDLDSGMEDVLLVISRTQSAFSSDGWGRRWNEDDLNSTSYLVRKRERKRSKPVALKFQALFGEEIRDYPVHICRGHIPTTGEKGFLVLKESQKVNPDAEIISTLQKTPIDAFWEGYRLKQGDVEKDFVAFKQELKKARTREKRRATAEAKKNAQKEE